MAIWQYDFELKVGKNIKKEDFIKDIETIFGEIFNEDNDYIDLGSYEGDRCTLYLKGGLIYKIECRLDLRVVNKNKIEKLFSLINKFDLEILIIEEKIVSKEELLEKIKNSKNLEFLKNGESFFEKLKEK